MELIKPQEEDRSKPAKLPSEHTFTQSEFTPESSSIWETSHKQPEKSRNLSSSSKVRIDRLQHQEKAHANIFKMPKRHAERPQGPQPTRRRLHQIHRSEPVLSLKDVSYISRTFKVPTAEDYPHLPSEIFRNPKNRLHNALQGRPEFKTITSTIGGEEYPAYRCQISFLNGSESKGVETVFGEGTSKVDLS